MSTDNPLVVPIIVEAYIVNPTIAPLNKNVVSFSLQRNVMEYSHLNEWGSAWPPGESAAPTSNGVYVKWRLPVALTRGVSDGRSVTFPLVPNRWLVVRYFDDGPGTPRQSTGWIIESDTFSASGKSAYVYSPPVGLPMSTAIGIDSALAQGWKEPGTAPFLTAIAPGNPAFSVFQPFCNSVFSFIDTLEGVTVPQPLSYCVIGWYSAADADPLSGIGSPHQFDEVLASLNWTIAAPGGATTTPGNDVASWSLYTGFVSGIQWQTTSPGPNAFPAGTVGISMGNNSVEALTALIAAQAGGDPEIDPQLLAAFQLNALHILDQPGGEVNLQELMQAAEFQKSDGGSQWQLIPTGSPPPPISPNEQALLDALNAAQTALDEANRVLASLQYQLYSVWWKWASYVVGSPHPVPQQELEAQLDPSSSTPTFASIVVQQQAEIETLQQTVANFVSALSSSPELELKNVPNPRFYAPSEPVVLLSGAGASGIVANSPLPLPCRFPSDLVDGFTCAGQQYLAAPATAPAISVSVPLPDGLSSVSGVPWSVDLVSAVLAECFFLDPDNAATIGSDVSASPALENELANAMADPLENAIGVLPNGFYPASPDAPAEAPLQRWQENPWHPIFISWNGYYFPIPYQLDGASPWTFDDEAYQWDSQQSQQQIAMGGQVVLTPAAAVNFSTQIQNLLNSYRFHGSPGSPGTFQSELDGLWELLGFVQSRDQWDLVSQALDGFNEQLLMRASGAYLGPQTQQPSGNPSVASLIGNAAGYPPATNGAFQPWRSGTFAFQNLSVIDEWGQTLLLVAPQGTDTFPSTLYQQQVVFSPALLQPARLDFTILSSSPANPILGWVVPNILDQSLIVYDAAGDLLGEIVVGAEDNPCWLSGTIASPASPDFGDSDFAAFLIGLLAQSGTTFQSFVTAIDSVTSNIVAPDNTFNQNLALLVGQPLAFVNAELQLELDGPALQDPSWANTPASPNAPVPSPEIEGYVFPVALGNIGQVDDGLVGYFAEGNFDRFNIVPAGEVAADGYLAPIGAKGNWIDLTFGGGPQLVSMLIDPRLPVHALSGILPVQSVQVPAADVGDALGQMNVVFRVDTILADQNTNGAVCIPIPIQDGTWSWNESIAGVIDSYPVSPPNPGAALSTQLPVLRRGTLQLSSAFINSPNKETS